MNPRVSRARLARASRVVCGTTRDRQRYTTGERSEEQGGLGERGGETWGAHRSAEFLEYPWFRMCLAGFATVLRCAVVCGHVNLGGGITIKVLPPPRLVHDPSRKEPDSLTSTSGAVDTSMYLSAG